MKHQFIVGYMAAKTKEAQWIYAHYLSILDSYLFESYHDKKYEKYINTLNKKKVHDD